MIFGFTPTMDSSGTWDSTCSSWHSGCSGRASHPMRVKSDYSAGKRVNIVELDVATRKHMEAYKSGSECVTHRLASSQAM